MSVVIFTILVILLCATIEELCTSVVTAQVRPQIMQSRGDVLVTVRVPPHPDNRRLILAWGSDDPAGQAGSTRRDIDGEDGPTLFSFPLRDVSPAHYKFLATVLDAAGKVRGHDEAFIVTPNEVQ